MGWQLLVTDEGAFYRVNTQNGATDLIVRTDFDDFEDVAVDSTGQVWAISDRELFRVDLSTGDVDRVRELPTRAGVGFDIEGSEAWISTDERSREAITFNFDLPNGGGAERTFDLEDGFTDSEGDLEIVGDKLYLLYEDFVFIFDLDSGDLLDAEDIDTRDGQGLTFERGQFHVFFDGDRMARLDPESGTLSVERVLDIADRDGDIYGAAAPDRGKIIGTRDNDTLQTPWEGVDVAGKRGNDRIKGEGGDNKLAGNLGRDKLRGLDGDDTLLGQKGKDKLFGGDDDDRMVGGKGRDLFRGGEGDDTMKGGAAKDRFVFSNNDDRDLIKGFNENQDILRLNDNLFNGRRSAADVVDDFGVQRGKKAVLNFDDGDKIVLKGVQLDELVSAIDIF